MARSTQITVPATNLSVGNFGPFTSPRLPAGITQFIVNVTPLTWPAAGTVLVLTVEESQDDGATWQFSASEYLVGGPWLDKQGNVITQETWVTTLMYTSGQRRIRLSVNVQQACRLSGSLSVQ